MLNKEIVEVEANRVVFIEVVSFETDVVVVKLVDVSVPLEIHLLEYSNT